MNTNRASAALLLVVVSATLLVFSPVLNNEFVEWDDRENFVDNEGYRGFGPAQLRWMATTFHLGVYQPLTWVLASTEYALGGLSPAVYHAGSWLLHAAMAAMVYVTASCLFRRRDASDPGPVQMASALAALLWALHPLRVESVAWASAQGYPLAGLFVLAAVVAHVHAVDALAPAVRIRWRGISILAAIAAYLAKPVAVTVPIVLLLIDWYPLRRIGGSRGERLTAVLGEKLPYVIPAALIAGLAPVARTSLGTVEGDYDLAARIAQSAFGIGYYLWKTLWPTDLSFFVPLAPDLNPLEPRFIAAGASVLVLATGLWIGRRSVPGLTAAGACYLALLLPVLGLIPQGAQLVADRYAYFAGVPLAIAVAGAAMALWSRGRQSPIVISAMTAGALIVLVGLGMSTSRYVEVWRDSATLFRHAAQADPIRFWSQLLAANPRSFSAHIRLGQALGESGRFEDALTQFDAASSLDPGQADPYFLRGLALARLGRFDDAIHAYKRGLSLRPEDERGLAYIADSYARVGNLAEAERAYRRAVAIEPRPDLFNELGVVLARQARYGEAAEAFRTALRLDPSHADARVNLSLSLQALTIDRDASTSEPASPP